MSHRFISLSRYDVITLLGRRCDQNDPCIVLVLVVSVLDVLEYLVQQLRIVLDVAVLDVLDYLVNCACPQQ